MIQKSFQSLTGMLSSLIREMVLVLGVGVLGSQLILSIGNSSSIVMPAEAATFAAGNEMVVLSDIRIHPDSTDPSYVEWIEIDVEHFNNSSPEELSIQLSTNVTKETFKCSMMNDATWRCTTPGLPLSKLTSVHVSNS